MLEKKAFADREGPARQWIAARLAREIARRKFPVRQSPERLKVVWPSVAIVNVICVLPYVAGQQRRGGAGQRSRRIAGIDDVERTIRILHQPGPPFGER